MADDTAVDADRQSLLAALYDAAVDYVLIGGAALETHHQPHETFDVDITPAADPDNLRRLAHLLNTLDCALRIDPDEAGSAVPLPSDYFTAETLGRADIWNLRTRHGELDIALKPAGFPTGYAELRRHARPMIAARTRIQVRVASLTDIEHSKRTANRAKDLQYLDRVNRRDDPRPGLER